MRLDWRTQPPPAGVRPRLNTPQAPQECLAHNILSTDKGSMTPMPFRSCCARSHEYVCTDGPVPGNFIPMSNVWSGCPLSIGDLSRDLLLWLVAQVHHASKAPPAWLEAKAQLTPTSPSTHHQNEAGKSEVMSIDLHLDTVSIPPADQSQWASLTSHPTGSGIPSQAEPPRALDFHAQSSL